MRRPPRRYAGKKGRAIVPLQYRYHSDPNPSCHIGRIRVRIFFIEIENIFFRHHARKQKANIRATARMFAANATHVKICKRNRRRETPCRKYLYRSNYTKSKFCIIEGRKTGKFRVKNGFYGLWSVDLGVQPITHTQIKLCRHFIERKSQQCVLRLRTDSRKGILHDRLHALLIKTYDHFARYLSYGSCGTIGSYRVSIRLF